MGYVVIKASGNAYALNRSMQNLTPVDSNYRKLIPNNATFAYKHVTLQGICTLDSVDLKNGTLPYEYRLCDSLGDLLDTSRPGVLINQINGVITLGENYDEQDVWVRLYPLIKTGYYATNTPKIYVKAITAGDWSPGIIPEPTVHTAILDSVVYSFGDNYNWNSNSLTAAETLLNLTSVTVTYDGQQSTFSGDDLTTFINDVTDTLILGLVSNTSIVNQTSTIRQFTVPANNSSNQRTINFTVSLKYKGISVSYTLTNGLMQEANTLVSIDTNSIKYLNLTSPITLDTGTTLSASDFTATGTFSNGTINTVSATGITLNGTSVNSVAQDLNTYTLTFASSITGTYTITGLTSIVEKAYIFNIGDLNGNPYPTKADNSSTWPLYVTVRHAGGSAATDSAMTFDLYNSSNFNEVKETYGNPVVTLNSSNPYNMATINSTNGSISYDLESSNPYVYDHTRIASISIPCTGDANDLLVTYSSGQQFTRKSIEDHQYFTQNFSEIPIATIENDQCVYDSNYVEQTNLSLHYSNDSYNYLTFGLGSGTNIPVYKLKLSNSDIRNGIYLRLSGSNNVALITSTTAPTAGTYSLSENNVLVSGDGFSGNLYVHYKPTSSGDTYLIDAISGSWPIRYGMSWYLLVPRNSEYGPVNITNLMSVSPASISMSGGNVTITPPTYSLTHGSETITNGASITYTLNGQEVIPSNNVILISENQTPTERTHTLVATVTLNGLSNTSTVIITQAANTSATVPSITSIVSSDPYGDFSDGTLITLDNKEQVEFPLKINLSNGTTTTLENYQNTYGVSSLYSGVTILTSSSSSDSVGAYPNDFKVNATNGNLIYDFKDETFAWDRSKITSITINGKSGVSNVVINSGIGSIYANTSSVISLHFEEIINWSAISFSTSGTKYKLDISSDDGATRLSLQESSSTNRLKKLTAASDGAYYIKFKSSEYPTISIFELPQNTSVVEGIDLRSVNKRVLKIGGSATAWKYLKLTPTTNNADVYFADNGSDVGEVYMGENLSS